MKKRIFIYCAAFLLFLVCLAGRAAFLRGQAARVVFNEKAAWFETDKNAKSARAAACGVDVPEQDAEYFAWLVRGVENKKDFFVLVDSAHKLEESFIPADMVDLKNYKNLTLNKDKMQLRKEAAEQLSLMQKNTKITLDVTSAYRSYSYQKRLFNNRVAQRGLEQTEKYTARPGSSQHQLGTAVDFGNTKMIFEDSRASRWMEKNASKYGFSLSFPKSEEKDGGIAYEPWHYRYITAYGTALQDKFFAGSQRRTLDFTHCFLEHSNIIK